MGFLNKFVNLAKETGFFSPAGWAYKLNNENHILDKYTGAWQTEQTNQANMQLAQQEWENNVKMWKMQNEYNLPANQMARFAQAGLNPNLIYGQGNPGNASQLPRYNRPQVDYSQYQPGKLLNVLGYISQFQDYGIKSAQTDNLKAQNLVIAEQAKRNALENRLLEITIPWKEIQYSVDANTYPGLKDLEMRTKKKGLRSIDLGQEKTIQDIAYSKAQQDATRSAQKLSETQRDRIIQEIRQKNISFDKEMTLRDAEIFARKYENELRALKINPNDSTLVRVIAQVLNEVGMDMETLVKIIQPTATQYLDQFERQQLKKRLHGYAKKYWEENPKSLF